MAITLLLVGGLIAFVGAIWMLVVAFRTSVLWGLGCLIVPFVSLIFLVLYWSDAKKPFLYQVLGAILMGVGFAMGPPMTTIE